MRHNSIIPRRHTGDEGLLEVLGMLISALPHKTQTLRRATAGSFGRSFFRHHSPQTGSGGFC